MSNNEIEEIESLLHLLMSSNNEERMKAEKTFQNGLAEYPDLISKCLVEITANSNEEKIQAFSMILLRQTIVPGPNFKWDKYSKETQLFIKKSLLELVANVTAPYLRNRICDAITAISQRSEWGELILFLIKLNEYNTSFHSATLLYLLKELSETMMDELKNESKKILEIFLKFSDPECKSIELRCFTVKALSSFIIKLSKNESTHFKICLPNILELILTLIKQGLDHELEECFKSLILIADFRPNFYNKEIINILEVMKMTMSSEEIGEGTKFISLEFLIILTEKAPLLISKIPIFLETILPIILNLIIQIDSNIDIETYCEQFTEHGYNSFAVVNNFIYRLGMSLKSKNLLVTIFNIITDFLNVNETDWRKPIAGLIAVSTIIFGCKRVMKDQVNDLILLVLPFFESENPIIQYQTCLCINKMAQVFSPTIQLGFHEQIVNSLFNLLDSKISELQSMSASCFVSFLQEVSETDILEPYYESILIKAFDLIKSETNLSVKENCISMIAATAISCEGNFGSYYDELAIFLKDILQNVNGSKYSLLKGKALECFCIIGIAVGKEMFEKDGIFLIRYTLELLENGVTYEDAIYVYIFQAWNKICSVFKESFFPFLSDILPILFELCKRDTNIEFEKKNLNTSQVMLFNTQGFALKNAISEEFSLIMENFYQFVDYLGVHYFPYSVETMESIIDFLDFEFDENVRTAVSSTLPLLFKSLVTAYEEKFENFVDLETLNKIFNIIVESLIASTFQEKDLSMVGLNLQSISDCLNFSNKLIDFSNLKFLVEELDKLTELSFSENQLIDDGFDDEFNDQQLDENENSNNNNNNNEDDEEDDDDDDDDDLEFDEELEKNRNENILLLSDIFENLFKHYFKEFIEIFQENFFNFFNEILLSENATFIERQSAICVFDNVIEFCDKDQKVLEFYWKEYGQSLCDCLSLPHPGLQQACAYGLGIFAIQSGDFFKKFSDPCINLLHQLIQDNNNEQSNGDVILVENAISAVGKFLQYQTNNIENVGKHFDVWLNYLPVLVDTVESKQTYDLLCLFIENENKFIIGENNENFPQIINIFGQILDTELINDGLSQRILNIIQQIINAFGVQDFSQLIQGIKNENAKLKLQKLI
ncbi:karyopherin (importin) beta [Anaeramoeba flamelloides]|uniref:Karyopherin (Importin) beta n=1 Tax=Anaeramoeba flamelloides TaxID=1746091 RepID=A0AAV7YHJ3_9EUKA|nr:karyopherin (importin) beta [Anaeramoeba flamelloides]